jgi:glycosyltransferase involved in cell wall biosynthesis
MQRYVGRIMSHAPHWPTQCRVASYMPIIPGLGKVRGDYDAVFGVGFPFTTFSYAALQTARAAGAPLILTPFLHLSTPGDPVNRTYTRAHQVRLLAESDLVVSPTPLATEAVAGWGIPRDRLMTLAMAIEHEDVTGGDGVKYRSKQGLRSGPVVGQLGALDPNKGTCDLVLAVARLNDARATPVTLLLAGSATPEFDAFLDEGGWRGRPWLRLLGPIEPGDVPDFYDALDVFAMPSRTDSFGIVYLEAWANGKPVVAAAAGGVPEVVTDGETGLLVGFGDVPALAASLARLIDDRAFARRVGEAGRSLVRSGYRDARRGLAREDGLNGESRGGYGRIQGALPGGPAGDARDRRRGRVGDRGERDVVHRILGACLAARPRGGRARGERREHPLLRGQPCQARAPAGSPRRAARRACL